MQPPHDAEQCRQLHGNDACQHITRMAAGLYLSWCDSAGKERKARQRCNECKFMKFGSSWQVRCTFTDARGREPSAKQHPSVALCAPRCSAILAHPLPRWRQFWPWVQGLSSFRKASPRASQSTEQLFDMHEGLMQAEECWQICRMFS